MPWYKSEVCLHRLWVSDGADRSGTNGSVNQSTHEPPKRVLTSCTGLPRARWNPSVWAFQWKSHNRLGLNSFALRACKATSSYVARTWWIRTCSFNILQDSLPEWSSALARPWGGLSEAFWWLNSSQYALATGASEALGFVQRSSHSAIERKRKRERENTLANITYLAVACGRKCLQVTAVPDPSLSSLCGPRM
jgi:hypothetical protein